MNTQTQRLADYFSKHPNQDIPMPKLHRIGSGTSNGFVASLTRRISDLREIGLQIIKSREDRVGNQRRTFYKLVEKV